jgi:hypothetical protein
VYACPAPSTATQNDDDAHETTGRSELPGWILSGALHELPSNVDACMSQSTAAQNDVVVHDTEAPGPAAPGSKLTAALHELPL